MHWLESGGFPRPVRATSRWSFRRHLRMLSDIRIGRDSADGSPGDDMKFERLGCRFDTLTIASPIRTGQRWGVRAPADPAAGDRVGGIPFTAPESSHGGIHRGKSC